MDFKALGKTMWNGSSELVANIAMSLVSIAYNKQLMVYYGENGVAAYGVIMYVGFVFVAVFLGYSMGVAPIIGYHYGAENPAELQNVYQKSKVIILAFSAAMFALSLGLSGPIARFYVGYDAGLMRLTENAFRIYSFSFLIMGGNIFASAFFTALNNGVISAVLSFTRTLVFQVLVVLTLPLLLGIDGIWWATFVAEVLALSVSVFFLLKMRKVYHY